MGGGGGGGGREKRVFFFFFFFILQAVEDNVILGSVRIAFFEHCCGEELSRK